MDYYFGYFADKDAHEGWEEIQEGACDMEEQARQENTEGEIEKLRHRLRLQDAVIRSGNVAALTDDERDAVEWFAKFGHSDDGGRAATLRGLLERLGGK
jgi:hypothetical protein